MKTCFVKLECRFLIGSAANENAKFPYKTAQSRAYIKINGMVWYGIHRIDLSQKTKFCH